MATIIENIQTLHSIKSDIKNAIIEKGGSVTDAFGGYAQAIKDLPSGGGDESFAKGMITGVFPYDYSNIIYNSSYTNVRDFAFYSTNVISVSFPNLSWVNANAFGRTVIKVIDFPLCSFVCAGAFAGCYNLQSINLPKVKSIRNGYTIDLEQGHDFTLDIYSRGAFEETFLSYDFDTNTSAYMNFDSLTYIGSRAFYGAQMPSLPQLSNVKYIGDYAFASFNAMNMWGPYWIDLRKCSYIGIEAIRSKTDDFMPFKISGFSFKDEVYIGKYAFYGQKGMNDKSITGAAKAVLWDESCFNSSAWQSNIWSSANYAKKIINVERYTGTEYGLAKQAMSHNVKYLSMPNCWYVDYDAFYFNYKTIVDISLPNVTSWPFSNYLYESKYLLSNFYNLSSLCLGIKYINQSYLFSSASNLTTIEFPNLSRITSDFVFFSCKNLSKATFGYSDSVVYLTSRTVFYKTSITSSTGSIFVPANLVDSYKTAHGWSYFKNVIFPIEG